MTNAKKTGFMEKDDEGKKRVPDGKLAKLPKNLLFNIIRSGRKHGRVEKKV